MLQLRNLIALFIVTILLPIYLMMFRIVSNVNVDYTLLSDEISLYQLREVLLLSYEMKINNDSLIFIYQGKEFSLSLINNKLILQPGTLIYLTNIESLSFKTNNHSIIIKYLKKGKEYEKIIAEKESFYFDNFSDSDDEYIDNHHIS